MARRRPVGLLLIALVVAILGVLVIIVVRQGQPRIVSGALNQRRESTSEHAFVIGTAPYCPTNAPGKATYVWLDKPNALELVIVTGPPDSFGSPRVQIQAVRTEHLGTHVERWYSNPALVCDLSADQSQHVLEHGVPDGLTNLFRDAALYVDWSLFRSLDTPHEVRRLDATGSFSNE